MLIRVNLINVIILIQSVFYIKCLLLRVLCSRFVLLNVYQCNVNITALLLLCTKCANNILKLFPVYYDIIMFAWLCVFYRDCMYNPPEKMPMIKRF